MLPATQTLVTAWLRHALRDLKDLHDATEAGTAQAFADGRRRRDRPRPLAIGRFELHEWARDRVWDCRAACCQLLDFQAPIETHLDLDYLRRRLIDYPDQHLVANVLEGARLDADVELQSVFVPHLVSLPLGYASVGKEVRRLHKLDWYRFHSSYFARTCAGRSSVIIFVVRTRNSYSDPVRFMELLSMIDGCHG